MNAAELKQDLIAYSKSIGIDKIGFAQATVFEELKQRLIVHEQKGYMSGFEEPDIEKERTRNCLCPEQNRLYRLPLRILQS